MASIVKETETQSSAPGTNTQTAAQPVALEVPVTVNGARTVDGSDKREPFSETTKTVLIFAHGAVIRLASVVTPGQLLFVTNENSKKEVVCQVVKSKNYRNVSGYVELEFTEPAAAFWGMRFPGERTSAKQTASSIPPKPITGQPAPSSPLKAPSSIPAVANTAPNTVPNPPVTGEAPPALAVERAPAAGSPVIDFPRMQDSKPASVLEDPKETSKAPASSWQPTAAGTDLLKQEAARLQKQLSSLSFQDEPPDARPELSKQDAHLSSEASKVIEIARAEEKSAVSTFEAPSKVAGSASQPRANLDLAGEELRIPAWLEPLARNAPPSTTTAATHVEAPKAMVAEPGSSSATAEEISDSAPQFEIAAPTFGFKLLNPDGETAVDAEPRKSGRALIIGLLAAGLILAAAGTWYFKFRPAPVVPAQATGSTPTFATLPKPADTNASSSEGNAEVPPSPGKEIAGVAPKRNDLPTTQSVSATGSNTSLPAEAARELVRIESAKKRAAIDARPAEQSAKKPSLGEVQFASPTVNAAGVNPEDVAAPPGPNFGGESAASGDVATAGLIAGRSKQPNAPVPVGGDVKTARLLHSVPPAYPSIARSQHISGDVVLDALIDATGRVSTMKVISGPVLLHQAAMDAVRQWRYQPAMLDDKPVAMHLNVKVQFRMQ